MGISITPNKKKRKSYSYNTLKTNSYNILKTNDFSNKGQVTVFVIIGLAVVGLFSLVYMARNIFSSGNTDVLLSAVQAENNNPEAVKSYVEGCMKKTADRITPNDEGLLWQFAKKGLYMNASDTVKKEIVLGERKENVTVLYNASAAPGNKNILRNNEEMEKELADYELAGFKDCFDETKLESLTGYAIASPQTASTAAVMNASINDNDVTFTLNYPMNLTKGNSFLYLDNFRIDAPLRLGRMINITSEIIAEMDSISGTFDLNSMCNRICDYSDNNILVYNITGIPDAAGVKLVDFYSDDNYFKKSYTLYFLVDGIEVQGVCSSC